MVCWCYSDGFQAPVRGEPADCVDQGEGGKSQGLEDEGGGDSKGHHGMSFAGMGIGAGQGLRGLGDGEGMVKLSHLLEHLEG